MISILEKITRIIMIIVIFCHIQQKWTNFYCSQLYLYLIFYLDPFSDLRVAPPPKPGFHGRGAGPSGAKTLGPTVAGIQLVGPWDQAAGGGRWAKESVVLSNGNTRVNIGNMVV